MDDETIIGLYWQRDEDAIAATAEKYGGYCTSIAQSILGSREDAEECVADTYLNAWNSIPPHRPNVLSAFLARIVRNLSFNRYRYNNAEKRRGSELTLVLDELSEVLTSGDDTEDELERKELVALIEAFLDTLTPKKRSIFIRRYWYADSVSAIAKRCGMNEGSVSVTLGRLRKKLQYILRGYET